jgi:nicotinic acid mononucleotide adenylyltransferase
MAPGSRFFSFSAVLQTVSQRPQRLNHFCARALDRRGWQVREVMILPVYRHHNTRDAVKRSLPLTYEHRFELCQLAAGDIARELAGIVECVSVSRLEEEIARGCHRPNLSAETFARLREQSAPALRLAFLLGTDSFSGEDPSSIIGSTWMSSCG